jgi:glycosyltransferase involved in cell wall biosynthesis
MQLECLEVVDRFVVLTGWAMDALMRNGARREKLALNRLGTGGNALPRKPGPEIAPTRVPVKVGYLGRFEALKGARELARAVASLDRTIPLRVEFRGPLRTASQREEMKQVSLAAGGDSRIIFGPEVEAKDVPKVLADYDVLCCPSLALEGGPTVAIEAHAVGTPVIGSRIGGLAEIVSDGVNGRLITPGDRAALAKVLQEIAENPAGTIDRWRTALPEARTMDAVAEDYLKVYAA